MPVRTLRGMFVEADENGSVATAVAHRRLALLIQLSSVFTKTKAASHRKAALHYYPDGQSYIGTMPGSPIIRLGERSGCSLLIGLFMSVRIRLPSGCAD